MANKPYIGGQAVIEGVMMRGPVCLSVAVRRPDGTIAVKEGPVKTKYPKLRTMPGIRGVYALVESVSIGYGALKFSALQQATEEEAKEMNESGGFTMMVSLVVAIMIFKFLPQLLASGLFWLLGMNVGPGEAVFHLVTGLFQLAVLLTYLGSISLIPDVRRVFQYHGAEHKTISAYEAGLELTVPNVKIQTTLHPRCGTTFLVIVVAISICFGAVITPLVIGHATGPLAWIQTFVLRVALLPLIAAVSFELQRFTARFCTTGPLRVFLWPGFLFQKITTREPDERQIEIAIAAMRAAMWREEVGAKEPWSDEARVYGGLQQLVEKLAPAQQSAA